MDVNMCLSRYQDNLLVLNKELNSVGLYVKLTIHIIDTGVTIFELEARTRVAGEQRHYARSYCWSSFQKAKQQLLKSIKIKTAEYACMCKC